MKIARFVCLVCLVLGVKVAAGQDALELPTDPTSYRQTPDNPYRTTEEVAQATKPATTLAPPVVRGGAPAQTPVGPTVVRAAAPPFRRNCGSIPSRSAATTTPPRPSAAKPSCGPNSG